MTRPAKDTLKYKNLVADLEKRPAYVKKAALLKALATGAQWKIDAVMDAFDKKPEDWQHGAGSDVVIQAAMFNRRAAVERLAKTFHWEEQHTKYAAARPVIEGFNTAVIHGHYALADYFHDLGAKPMYRAEQSPQALYSAVDEGDAKKMDYLLDKGADASHMLYHVVARPNADLNFVRHLVEDRHADIDKPVERGYAVFGVAVQQERYDIADYLLSKGAKPGDDPASASNIMFSALETRNSHTLDYVLAAGVKPGISHLHQVLLQGSRLDDAEKLVQAGSLDVTAQGNRALLLATISPDPEAGFAFVVRHGGKPEEALATLKREPQSYPQLRDGMLKFLESRLPPKSPAPSAPGL